MSDERRREGFGRGMHLRKRPEFLSVQEKGRRQAGRCYVVYVLARATEPSPRKLPRFGVTVSKKVGPSVTRNRVKRWVRESCRRLAPTLSTANDYVVIARAAAATLGYQQTAREISGLLERARRLP